MARVTLKDIAQAANVSQMTVSNVINGRRARASEETIKRIQTAVEELGYTPNLSARSLASNVSRLVGVLVPFTEDQNKLLLDNPFYAEMVSGIESALRRAGYHMMLAGIDETNIDLSPLAHWNVDGLIVLGIYEEALYAELKKHDLPTLLIDSYVEDDHFHHLRLDDAAAAEAATRYLIGKGHERIALVTGAVRTSGVIERRFAGYRAALEAAGLAFDPDLVFDGSVSFTWGRTAASQLIAAKGVTAAFCTADLIAAGLVAGLHGEGVQVPGDISVVGFDNISLAEMVFPALTTIDQAILSKGERAGELITRILGGQDLPRETLSPIRLVERDSVRQRTGGA